MATIGYLLVLIGVVLFTAVLRGRALHVTKDVSDAVLALVTGDAEALKEVFARKGEDTSDDVGSAVGVAAGKAVADVASQLNDHRYRLGKVKAHVERAAYALGPKHGIKTVYGYSATGSVANSDHPKGLALDFMTSDRAVGDALARDALAYPGVSYVIWWRQINTGAGWKPYTGPRDHKDHVHVSFEPAPSASTPGASDR